MVLTATTFGYKAQINNSYAKTLYRRYGLGDQLYQSLKGEQRAKYMQNHITGPTHHIKDKSYSLATANPHPLKEIRLKFRVVRPVRRVVPAAGESRLRV